MKHYNEEQLLGFVLETAPEDEYKNIQVHINECSACQKRADKIRNDIEIISSVNPKEVIVEHVSEKTKNIPYSLLKTAALIIFGFGIGYFAGGYNTSLQTIHSVEPSYIKLKAAESAQIGIAASDVTFWKDTFISGGI